MEANKIESDSLIFDDVDILFMYSFDFGHSIDSQKIINMLKLSDEPLAQFNHNDPKKNFDERNKFIKDMSFLDKTYISEEDVFLNKYSRIVFNKYNYSNKKIKTNLIIFGTLYDLGIGILTVWVPLRGKYNIYEIIDIVNLGLPPFPYSVVKKIPIKAYQDYKNINFKRIDYIGYTFIQQILEKEKQIGLKRNEDIPVYSKIDCYPYITIRGYNENTPIDKFGEKYRNELWGILSGDMTFSTLRKETMNSYLNNVAIFNDRLALPSEDGTIYVFGYEAEQVYKKTISAQSKNMPSINNFQDFIQYRMLAYYLFTEFYRFEVFNLKVLSWKLSIFLDTKLPNSSMDEIIKYYYLFSKNLEHYYNFGDYLLIYLPTWNRQVWKSLREKEVSDSYNHLIEGLKIINTTVQLSNSIKNQSYAIIVSILLVLLNIISTCELTYWIKVLLAIFSTVLTCSVVWLLLNWYFRKKLKNLIIIK